jgi:hypothetical protein
VFLHSAVGGRVADLVQHLSVDVIAGVVHHARAACCAVRTARFGRENTKMSAPPNFKKYTVQNTSLFVTRGLRATHTQRRVQWRPALSAPASSEITVTTQLPSPMIRVVSRATMR